MCTNIWVNIGVNIWEAGYLLAYQYIFIYVFLLLMAQAIDLHRVTICFTSLNIVPNQSN